jgi:tetratricopeptide (TPR) repeat protein
MHNLAISYEEANRPEEALRLREQVLPLRCKVNGPDSADTVLARLNLAHSYETAGRRDEAIKLQEQALATRLKVNGPVKPRTLDAMISLAYSYCAVGRNKEALAVMAQAIKGKPTDTLNCLVLASWQTWFDQVADYEATRRRAVQLAEGTDQAPTAERAARVFCLRPSSDAALLAQALKLARRGVELGQSDPALPWYELALGIAEYRNGLATAAEATLTIAEKAVADNRFFPADEQRRLQGAARAFRAMSLFRQDRAEEARSLLRQVEAEIPASPEDANKPLIDGNMAPHNVLIWWLAYKEAKSLIESPAAPVAGPSGLK